MPAFIFVSTQSPACIADINESRLVTSVKWCGDPCSGPRRTRRIIGSAFRISYHPDWQIVNRFLIGQPCGVYSNPGTQDVGAEGFHRCFSSFAEGFNQSSVLSVTQATQPLVRTV